MTRQRTSRSDPERDAVRRRRELIAAGIIALVLAILFWSESVFFDFAGDIGQGNLIFFALINVNVILACVLLFLILRNVTKLVFERRRGVLGAKLRTRLVVAFAAFALVPTFLLFYVAMTFISNSIERWFSLQIETSLNESMAIAQNLYRVTESRAVSHAEQLAESLSIEDMVAVWRDDQNETAQTEAAEKLSALLAKRREIILVESVELYPSPTAKPLVSVGGALTAKAWRSSPRKFIEAGFAGETKSRTDTMGSGELARGMAPVLDTENGGVKAVVVVGFHVPASLLGRLKVIQKTYDEYRQLKLLRTPIRTNYFVYLGLISFFIFFSATWFGFYLARQITEPLQLLAEGAEAVAKGELDVRVEQVADDEIGALVYTFNKMLDDLSASRLALETTMTNLELSNVELERRRASMAAVLDNIAAGVIAFDSQARVTTVNPSAERILAITAADTVGRRGQDVFAEQLINAFQALRQEADRSASAVVQRQVEVQIAGELRTLLAVFSRFRSSPQGPEGSVLVVEDLTELLRAQRVAAWQEIARRIAHEIKNPLTPIQLAAQRLRRRYGSRFDPEKDQVFFESTDIIVRQVEEMKAMVGEFSEFARMAEAKPSPTEVADVVHEAVVLFREAHKTIAFESHIDGDIPRLMLDREQIKRALINVIDNAVAAISGSGEITVSVRLSGGGKHLLLEVADDGEGLPGAYRSRLFEPYFSTKKMGTGLGLSIVHRIVHDHGGTVQLRDNQPKGTIVVIEIPVRAA
ncbi:MAG: ATP-binding protein [Candidatus Lernaella stagnicola]|nr:ATP-binding protein [Candidatus Lernaella stagnicola]